MTVNFSLFALTDLLSSLPLCELDGCDFPLGGIVLEGITLQTPTHDLGRHIGVLDVAEIERTRHMDGYKNKAKRSAK